MGKAFTETGICGDVERAAEEYLRVREFTSQIVEPLTPEDCAIQSMPDASPTRWHLAHTTWFFETFILKALPGYEVFDDRFEYLFNSYYNTVGEQYPRDRRGLISRPGLDGILAYRQHVDKALLAALQEGAFPDSLFSVLTIGLHHEQQHQELMLTDIKHTFSCNPILPSYTDFDGPPNASAALIQWNHVEGGVVSIGHDSDAFCFDNELPRHQVFLDDFELASRTVTVGDYLEFIEDGGYENPQHWQSMGWKTVQSEGWRAPLYWVERDGWRQFTLGGLRPLDLSQPVCHVSYFEADAFARWSGRRLPTEFEWEHAIQSQAIRGLSGVFADRLLAEDHVVHPQTVADDQPLGDALGNVWEWTASQYSAYPGYSTLEGALGEYNGKFMCNQFVLRGGSCATPSGHVRATYRNFFPPEARWQFSGIRLARSVR